MPYLELQKSGIYRYRCKVPKAIQDCVGTENVKESLRTRDKALAIERWKIVDSQTNERFRRCRNRKKVVLSDKALAAIAHNSSRMALFDDMDVRSKGYEVLPDAERFPFLDPFAPVEEQQALTTPMSAVAQQAADSHFLIEELELALALDDYSSLPETVANRIATTLKVQGHKGKIADPTYRTFVASEIEAQQGIISRCEGQSVPTPELVPVQGSLLSIEATKWKEEKSVKDWKIDTARRFMAAIHLFIAMIGDKDISEYKKDDARTFRQMLLKYPPRTNCTPELKGLTPSQIIKLNREPMDTANASLIFSRVGSFFNEAIKGYDCMKLNPFEKQGIKRKYDPSKRSPFKIEELNTVFQAPLYHGVKSARIWSRAGDYSMKNTGKYWITLIGLFAGMRLGEIVQLHVDDIKYQDGILIFDICRGEDKSTFKTDAAFRQIPVHSELVKCGLLGHQKKCTGKRLFPEMKANPDGKYTEYASNWFNARFLKGLGIKRKDLVFHSLRYCFEDAIMNTGAQDSMVDMLQGHILEKMKRVYVTDIDLKMKNEFVQKIEYEGLDLSHIFMFEPRRS